MASKPKLITCPRCGVPTPRNRMSIYSKFCKDRCDPNTPLPNLARERGFVATKMATRDLKRKDYIKYNQVPEVRVDRQPFRRNSLIMKFFDRAMRPKGIPLLEIMAVCKYLGGRKVKFCQMFTKLTNGVNPQGWKWTAVLQDQVLYISEVQLAGHGHHTYQGDGTKVLLTETT